MRRRPPRSTRIDTLFPYTTLFRSRTPGTWSSAATKCISEVPGLAKQVSTPDASSVRTRLSAPFIPGFSLLNRAAIKPDRGLPQQGGAAGFIGDRLTRAVGPEESDEAGKRSEEHTSELQSLMRISYA